MSKYINPLTDFGNSIVVGAATGGGANAGWFGDGRDGALNVADGQTLALPVALDEGQIVKQYTSGYIGTTKLPDISFSPSCRFVSSASPVNSASFTITSPCTILASAGT